MRFQPEHGSAWRGYQASVCPACDERQLTQIRRRDWELILRALELAGLSPQEVGRRVGRAKTSVYHWIKGGEPKESDARKVLALYRQFVGEPLP